MVDLPEARGLLPGNHSLAGLFLRMRIARTTLTGQPCRAAGRLLVYEVVETDRTLLQVV